MSNVGTSNDQREELLRLWASTENLHRRFYGDMPISFDARWRVFNEEVGELLLEAAKCAVFDTTYGDTAKECADVIVTAMGLLMGLGITYDDLSNAIQATITKNDSKTLQSHEIRADGKIARRKEVDA